MEEEAISKRPSTYPLFSKHLTVNNKYKYLATTNNSNKLRK